MNLFEPPNHSCIKNFLKNLKTPFIRGLSSHYPVVFNSAVAGHCPYAWNEHQKYISLERLRCTVNHSCEKWSKGDTL